MSLQERPKSGPRAAMGGPRAAKGGTRAARGGPRATKSGPIAAQEWPRAGPAVGLVVEQKVSQVGGIGR